MAATADDLVAEYLRRLKRALRALPRARRRELVDEIREHIAAGRADLPDQSEAVVRTLLDRIGEPEEIAAEARERFGLSGRPAGAREVWAVALLLLGGAIVPVLGWLAGVALLWASPIWTRRDKLIGTLVPPGGLSLVSLLAVGAVSPEQCSGMLDARGNVIEETCTGGGVSLAVIVILATIAITLATTAYLAARLRGRFVHAHA